ncbi:hypothetical protein CcaverHIS002_0407400 [Cutaneotrichosporon cavernicola]|nr:hypothetical protein CcaverHIS002_0407400 [Cutaneotrichosporon cavernicola]BEJ07466.1 hypothetical protein CcaverHIS641_0407350 [Cutaneotrichosporon cavernicola]
MSFTVLFTLVAAASASATAVAERELTRDEVTAMRAAYRGHDARAAASLGERSLERRQCTDSSCDCIYIPEGLFCGDGLLNCQYGHVYQCSGGSYSCDYGPRDSCGECGALSC